MKYLSLSIPGYNVPVPTGVKEISDKAGPFGQNILKLGIEILFISAFVLALVFLVWGGIGWITSQGNKESLQKARQTLIYSIFGLVIILLSFLLVRIINYFFGIPLV